MAAKIIAVSDDDVTYYTLPGSTGDLNFEGASASDTVFGASFSSTQPTLISWTASANAYYKGLAGYEANFLKTGTSTATTGEAMELVSGKTYKITAATKNVWDRTATITIYDNAVAVDAANIASIDHLFGRVTFEAAYTPTGPITADINYLPLTPVGTAREFSLTMNAESVDTTDFATAQANGGYNTFVAGLKTVSLDASGFYALSNGFKALLQAKTELVVEINPDGSNLSTARGFFKATTTGQSGDVGGNEDESITFELSVPAAGDTVYTNVVTPFKWIHETASTLSTAVQKVTNSWEGGSLLYVKYLDDGTNGNKGQSVITDCSLSTSVDGINEYSISFQGTGAPTVV